MAAINLYAYQSNFLLSSFKDLLIKEGVKRGLWALDPNKSYVTFTANVASFFSTVKKDSHNSGIVFTLIDDRIDLNTNNKDLTQTSIMSHYDAVFECYVYSTHQYSLIAREGNNPVNSPRVIGINDLYKLIGNVLQAVNNRKIGIKDGYFDASKYITDMGLKDKNNNPLAVKDFINFSLEFYDSRDWNRQAFNGTFDDLKTQVYKCSFFLHRVHYPDTAEIYSDLTYILDAFDPTEDSLGQMIDPPSPEWFYNN